MRGIAGSLSRGVRGGRLLNNAQQPGSSSAGGIANARTSYSGRLSAPQGSAAPVADRVFAPASVSLSQGEKLANSLQDTSAAFAVAPTGFRQQQLAGGRLETPAIPVPDRLSRIKGGHRGDIAADQEYDTLLNESRASYDLARAGAREDFDTEVGAARTKFLADARKKYDDEVEVARREHQNRFGAAIERAETQHNTTEDLAETQWGRDAGTALRTFQYQINNPNFYRPQQRDENLRNYQKYWSGHPSNATAKRYPRRPFESPHPFSPSPYVEPTFNAPEFEYADYVAPERRQPFVPPSAGSPVIPQQSTYTPSLGPTSGGPVVDNSLYSAYGGYHFRPSDILEYRPNGAVLARATRYNGYQAPRLFQPGAFYHQPSASLTPENLRNFKIYSGTVLS